MSPLTAFEAFTGYLVLDALVANQDRHEENWAVLRPLPGGGEVTLAGSYDHGSSLAFNLTDARRIPYVRMVRSLAEPELTISRINGPDVPPGYRLLVTLRGTLPAGYRAFSGPEWALAGGNAAA